MRTLKATQKIALAVSLGSCSAPQNEITAKPPIVDVPGHSLAVTDSSTMGQSVKEPPEQSHWNCVQLAYLIATIRQECNAFCPEIESPKVILPDSTGELLKGRIIREGDNLVLIKTEQAALRGKLSISVGDIDQSGVEFRLRYHKWVDLKALATYGYSQSEKQHVVDTFASSFEDIFFVNFDGTRSPDAVLLDSLQPGRLSITPGPSAGSAILKYDYVMPCD